MFEIALSSYISLGKAWCYVALPTSTVEKMWWAPAFQLPIPGLRQSGARVLLLQYKIQPRGAPKSMHLSGVKWELSSHKGCPVDLRMQSFVAIYWACKYMLSCALPFTAHSIMTVICSHGCTIMPTHRAQNKNSPHFPEVLLRYSCPPEVNVYPLRCVYTSVFTFTKSNAHSSLQSRLEGVPSPQVHLFGTHHSATPYLAQTSA